MLLAFSWSTSAASSLVGAALGAAGLWLNARWRRRDEQIQQTQIESGSRDLAREEAMDLARVRGEAIEDLHRELGELKMQFETERADHLKGLERLQGALDLSRAQSLETQQMLAHGVRGLLEWLLAQLEHDPPRIDVAVRRIREALADADPTPPGQRRRTA